MSQHSHPETSQHRGPEPDSESESDPDAQNLNQIKRASKRNSARTRRHVAEHLLAELNARADSFLYTKAKYVARETTFSINEVAKAFARLNQTPVPVTAEPWTDANTSTWIVKRTSEDATADTSGHEEPVDTGGQSAGGDA
jgi:hypothetical protein